MTQRPEIEDCPFCGSKELEVIAYGMEQIHEDPTDRSHAVCCDKCGALGPELAPRQRAIETWNNRVQSAGELHWRNNHASVVAKSRILIERLDMPVERVQAYKYITEMEDRIDLLEAEIFRLRGTT